MKITFTGRKVTLKDSFKEKAEKKLQKFDRFFENDTEAAVKVTVEKERQTVEITIKSRGIIYRVEETTKDMQCSLDDAVDSLMSQIRKNKTRLEKRLKTGAFDNDAAADTEKDYDVVKIKKFALKPMDVDEAILQMNLMDHEFFTFLNADTDSINVVYKRRDGGYGVLEPSVG